MFYLTTSPSGKNIFSCTLTNVWVLQNTSIDIPSLTGQNGKYLSNSGSQLQWTSPPSGSTTIRTQGSTVATTTAVDLSAGSGLLATLATGAQGVSVVYALDTSVAATRAFLQGGSALNCVSTGGTGTSYTCSLNPALTQYTTGMRVHWQPQVAGTGGETTLNINNLGARRVRLSDGVEDPRAGDILAGRQQTLSYDGVGFRIVEEKTSRLQANAFCSSSSGSATAYSCNLSPAIAAYTNGLGFYWKPDVDGAAGTVTLAVNGLAATDVRTGDGTVLPRAGDILAGEIYFVIFEGGVFRLTRQPTKATGSDAYCVSPSGTGQAFVCNVTPAVRNLDTGLTVKWIPDRNGAGGATTLNVNGLGDTPLKLSDGTSNPQPGDIINNRVHEAVFDGTSFRLNWRPALNQTASADRPACSISLQGRLWFTVGATDQKDSLAVCAKDNANAFGWRSLY